MAKPPVYILLLRFPALPQATETKNNLHSIFQQINSHSKVFETFFQSPRLSAGLIFTTRTFRCFCLLYAIDFDMMDKICPLIDGSRFARYLV